MIEDLFLELEDLYKDHDIVWTIGSGEAQDTLYCGIAYPRNSDIWRNAAAWFTSNDLVEMLQWMIKSVKANITSI